MGVSKNNGIPKSSILIGFSIINHPFWGIPIFGNTQMYLLTVQFSLHVTLPESYCTTEAPQQNIERWAFVVIYKGELQRFFFGHRENGQNHEVLGKKGGKWWDLYYLYTYYINALQFCWLCIDLEIKYTCLHVLETSLSFRERFVLRKVSKPTKHHYKTKYQLGEAFLVSKDPFKLKSAKVWNKTPAGSRSIHGYIKHWFQGEIRLQVAAHSEGG